MKYLEAAVKENPDGKWLILNHCYTILPVRERVYLTTEILVKVEFRLKAG